MSIKNPNKAVPKAVANTINAVVKALTTALMVFATAFGTALFGFLIDIGFTIGDISIVSGIYIFISLILLFFIRKRLNPILI